MSKKTPPKVQDKDVQRAVDKIYDEINALSKAVNKESTYDSRTEGEGKSGDTRVFYDTSSDKYYIEGRTQGGWGKTRLYLKGDALEYVTGGGAVDWSTDQGGSPVINAGNYTSYTNSEAVTAMGAKNDSNALNHDKYTHPSLQHIPANGSAEQYVKYSQAGTGTWADLPLTGGANTLSDSSLPTTNGYAGVFKELSTQALKLYSLKAGNNITLDKNNAENEADTYIEISASSVSYPISVSNGGTGATNASDARDNLSVDPLGTDNSTNVTLTGTPDYLTISGQVITRGAIVLTTDVSGSLPDANIASASTWNGMLDSALGNGGASSVSLVKTANDEGTAQLRNIKAGGSITIAIDGTDDHINIGGGGLTTVALGSNVTGTLPIANGGTNSANASDARDALGVDPLGTDNSTNVSLAGTLDYLTISGQVITRSAIVLTTDVSGNLPDGNIASASTWNAMVDSCLGNGGTGAVSVVKTSNDSGTIQLRNIKGTGSITVAVDGTEDHINIGGGGLTSVALASNVTGVLPIANGGTGSTTAENALNALGGATLGHNHDSAYDNYGSWTLKDHSGDNYTVTSADTMQIKQGTGISVNFTADDVMTITNTAPDVNHDVNHYNWDGSDTGLNDVTGRASLGLGTAAQSASGDFAASSHDHSAGNITSGTLAVGRGGTGVTTVAAIKTTLGLGSAAYVDLSSQDLTDIGNLSNTNSGDQILPTRDSLGVDTDDTVRFGNVEVDNNLWINGYTDSTASRIRFHHNGTDAYQDWETGNYYIRYNTTSKFRLTSSGQLDCDADVIAYSTAVSDIRLKDNIEPMVGNLEKLAMLTPISYEYKERRDGKHLGLSAQEVEEIFPDIVKERDLMSFGKEGEEFKTVRQQELIPVLIGAIKELKEELDELKCR